MQAFKKPALCCVPAVCQEDDWAKALDFGAGPEAVMGCDSWSLGNARVYFACGRYVDYCGQRVDQGRIAIFPPTKMPIKTPPDPSVLPESFQPHYQEMESSALCLHLGVSLPCP